MLFKNVKVMKDMESLRSCPRLKETKGTWQVNATMILNRVCGVVGILFLKNKFIYFIYFFIFGCAGSSLLRVGPLQLQGAGTTPRWVCGPLIGVASLSAVPGLQARRLQQLWLTSSRVQAQQLWRTDPAAPRHVGSSRTRARTRVPCIGRRTLNH